MLLSLVLLLTLVAATEMMRNGPLWRAVYPFLPRQAQAVPYVLRSRLAGPKATPVLLPTPALVGSSDNDIGTRTATIDPASDLRANAPGGDDSLPADSTSALATAERSPDADPIRSSTASPSPSPPPPPLPTLALSASLTGLRHEYQTWNNCGPATISMALGLVGDEIDQAKAARWLKPDPDDKNVSPDEMARFAAERGFGSVMRGGGDTDMLQHLLALGFPIVAETWFVPDPGDEMGHYRVITGYHRSSADEGLVFEAADSYLGPAIEIAASKLDEDWRAFNRAFIVVYPKERENEVAMVLGRRWDASESVEHSAAVAMNELAQTEDLWAWYNLGASLLGLGDSMAASRAFDKARAIGLPWRLLWYRFEAFEAYAAVKRWDDVLALAEANLKNAPNLEESHYWRGRALEAKGDEASALKAYREALRLNPRFAPAMEALQDR